MNTKAFLEELIPSYRTYYDVKTEDVEAPFVAEAEFHSHEERFFLSRRAIIDEVENNEKVYFATIDTLTCEDFYKLDEEAWRRGTASVKPSEHHQSSDVSLIIIASSINIDAFKAIKKTKHTLSYKHCLHGYSNYHLIAVDLSSGTIVHNPLGYTMKKIVRSVLREK